MKQIKSIRGNDTFDSLMTAVRTAVEAFVLAPDPSAEQDACEFAMCKAEEALIEFIDGHTAQVVASVLRAVREKGAEKVLALE